MKRLIYNLLAILTLLTAADASALRLETIPYGNMQGWVTRNISESSAIGGKTKTVYAIGPNATINGNKAYVPASGNPWGSSNVYAKVMGINKGSNTVSPANMGGSKVALLETKLEEVKVLGLINMDVLVAGSIFLGRVFEPISDANGPFKKMEMGIPYKKRPVALVYDFAVEMPNTKTRIKATGTGGKKTLQGRDQAEVYVILQKRWEDAKGNLYAQRVGTGRERYASSRGWQKGHQLKIQYGDITGTPGYKSYMGLLSGSKAYYARNSKGKMKPVNEVGWAPANTEPTHVLVMASSSCGTPFVGTPGVKMYIDNISFGF